MRRVMQVALVVLFGVMTVVPASAQVSDEMTMTLQAIQGERQKLVADAMGLTPEEAEAFWPIYYRYMAEISELRNRYANLVRSFARDSATMDDETLKKAFHELVAVQKKWLEIQERTFDEVASAVGVRKAVAFAQVENRLRTLVQYKLMKELPMVGTHRQAAN